MQKIPHHRSPVILKPYQEKAWLRINTPLTDVTAMLQTFDFTQMDVYPVDPKIKSIYEDNSALILSLGEHLNSDQDVNVKDQFK